MKACNHKWFMAVYLGERCPACDIEANLDAVSKMCLQLEEKNNELKDILGINEGLPEDYMPF